MTRIFCVILVFLMSKLDSDLSHIRHRNGHPSSGKKCSTGSTEVDSDADGDCHGLDDSASAAPTNVSPVSVVGRTKLRKVIKTGAAAKRSKQKQICEALHDTNINLLNHLAITSNGLLSKSIRRRVWPKLIDLDVRDINDETTELDFSSHQEYQQVYIDVQRSLRRFPRDMDPEERTKLQEKLTNMIMKILLRHSELHYYQGYHDICVTFLVEVGEELAFAIMDKLSVTVLKIYMEPTMESTTKLLHCIWPIIRKYNPSLLEHLEASGVNTVFCLSWVITWFGHVLKNLDDITRLYDFFLVSHKLMPVYLSAAIVLNREEEILALEQDMATVHHFLCSLPKHMPLEILVKRALQISQEYPPDRLIIDAELITAFKI